jgi:dTDP-glucose pyrophosphorylase/predicted transcriptional regulator
LKWAGDADGQLAKMLVSRDATLLEAMRVLEEGAQAIAFVRDGEGRVIGTLTDGDIRRAILRGARLDSNGITGVMRKDFAYAVASTSRAEVLDIMRARDIGALPILDGDGRLCGLHTIGQIISSRERENSAVILAGGKGTRLAPITESIPKPMLKVAGRPILERLVLHLMSHGIRRIYLAVNYMAEAIEEHFGDGAAFGCEIHYLKEKRPLGTGGPLSLLPSSIDDAVLVVNGDLITQCDFGGMIDFHERGQYVATFGVRPYTVNIPFGVARVDGDLLTEIREKPTERVMINAGIYVLSRDAIALIPRNEPYPITDLFTRCIELGMHVGAHVVAEDWEDIGRHEQLRRARGEL